MWLHASENAGYSKIIARLKPGVTLAQVRDDANRVRLELNPRSRDIVSVEPLGESVVGGLRRLLLVVLAGALLVLLIACANVATLFIGRDVARQRELAARMALGATAPQLRSECPGRDVTDRRDGIAPRDGPGDGDTQDICQPGGRQHFGTSPRGHRMADCSPDCHLDDRGHADLRCGARVACRAGGLQPLAACVSRVSSPWVACARRARRGADCVVLRAADWSRIAGSNGVCPDARRPRLSAERRARGEGRAVGHRVVQWNQK